MTHKRSSLEYVYLEPDDSPYIYVEHFKNWTTSAAYPHRHAYHEIMWFQTGGGSHLIDETLVTIVPGTVALISQGQVHAFQHADTLSAYMLCFIDDFFEVESAGEIKSYRTLFNYLRKDQTLTIPKAEWERGNQLLTVINAEYEHASATQDYVVLRPLMRAFLHQLERIKQWAQHEQDHTTHEQEHLYWEFINLLEQEFCQHHEVGFYSRALNQTPEQLSTVLQRVLGKSTKRVIVERLMLEARRHLQFSTFSVKEIAVLLGFVDPFHFSKTFKRETGFSPLGYREHMAS